MIPDWRNWCRLCSNCNEDHSDFNYSFIKIESVNDLAETMQTFLNLLMTTNAQLPSKICHNCLKFLEQLSFFADRCLKSNAMYSEIWSLFTINSLEPQAHDLKMLRQKFQFVDSFEKYIVPDENEFAKANKIGVKIEEPEEETLLTVFDGTQKDPDDSKYESENESSTAGDESETQNDINFESEDDEDDNSDLLKSKEQVTGIEKSTRIEILRCESCDRTFTKRHNYQLHVNSKNCIKGLMFRCEQCPKIFNSEKRLKVHMKVHLPDEMKMIYPCSFCDKKFTKSVNVKAHIKSIHLNEKPFICEECGKPFKTRGALKEHQVIHSDECPFACSYCPMRFKNNPRLKSHEDTHKDTSYKCPTCGLKLNSRNTLRSHMVVHSDVKNYKCQYCGNAYKRQKTLKNHIILHTGLRPFICPYCEQSFTSHSHCRTHQKKFHPSEFQATIGKPQTIKRLPELTNLPFSVNPIHRSHSTKNGQTVSNIADVETDLSHSSPKNNIQIIKDEGALLTEGPELQESDIKLNIVSVKFEKNEITEFG